MAMISTMFFLLIFPPGTFDIVPEGYWMSRFGTIGVGCLAANICLGCLGENHLG